MYFPDDAQVAELIAEFKQATQKLIDLLDISVPAVAKLKVRGKVLYAIFYWYAYVSNTVSS